MPTNLKSFTYAVYVVARFLTSILGATLLAVPRKVGGCIATTVAKCMAPSGLDRAFAAHDDAALGCNPGLPGKGRPRGRRACWEPSQRRPRGTGPGAIIPADRRLPISE